MVFFPVLVEYVAPLSDGVAVLDGVTVGVPRSESTADNPDRSRLGAGEGVTPTAGERLPKDVLAMTAPPFALWVVRTCVSKAWMVASDKASTLRVRE